MTTAEIIRIDPSWISKFGSWNCIATKVDVKVWAVIVVIVAVCSVVMVLVRTFDTVWLPVSVTMRVEVVVPVVTAVLVTLVVEVWALVIEDMIVVTAFG